MTTMLDRPIETPALDLPPVEQAVGTIRNLKGDVLVTWHVGNETEEGLAKIAFNSIVREGKMLFSTGKGDVDGTQVKEFAGTTTDVIVVPQIVGG